MPSPGTLVHGEFYHIFNCGTNRDDIFMEDRNYSFFLDRYKRYVSSLVETYAYCLLRNHFHFLVRIKDYEQLPESLWFKKPGIIFGRLFSTYAKSFNSIYGHSGSVFEHPFGRVRIRTGSQLMRVVTYIHQNPEKHGYVDDFREWRFSSYLALQSSAAPLSYGAYFPGLN